MKTSNRILRLNDQVFSTSIYWPLKSPNEHLLTDGSYSATKSGERRTTTLRMKSTSTTKVPQHMPWLCFLHLGALTVPWALDVVHRLFLSKPWKGGKRGSVWQGLLHSPHGSAELQLFHQLVLICILQRYVNLELSTRPTLTIKGPPHSILKGSHQCMQFTCTCI